jgi:hypothetical protein
MSILTAPPENGVIFKHRRRASGTKLRELYDRYVDRYGKKLEKSSRSDDDVMRTFRAPLAQRQVLSRLTKKRITGKDDEYEFPYAWKNGR